jgi:hypothetical protein
MAKRPAKKPKRSQPRKRPKKKSAPRIDLQMVIPGSEEAGKLGISDCSACS